MRRWTGLCLTVMMTLLATMAWGADLAHLFGPETTIFVQVTSGVKGMEVLETWTGPLAKGGQNVIQSSYQELANLMGLERERVPEELKKVECLAAGVIGVNQESGEPMVLLTVDTGESTAAREALRKKMGLETAKPAERIGDVDILRGEGIECPGATQGVGYCAFSGSVFVLGPTLESVKEAVLRGLGGEARPGLNTEAMFRAATGKLDADRSVTVYCASSGLRTALMVAGKGDRDVDRVWEAADLSDVEYVCGQLTLKGERSMGRWHLKFKPGSRPLEAVRTPPASRELLKRIPADYPVVITMNVGDGEALYGRFATLAREVEEAVDAHDFTQWEQDLQKLLGVEMPEAMGNVVEAAVGWIPAGEATAWITTVLAVLETPDPVKTATLVQKAEKEYLAGAGERTVMREVEYQGVRVHYAERDGQPLAEGLNYVLDANVLTVGTSRKAVLDAVKTWGTKRNMLETAVYAQALENLPAGTSKVALVDLIGLAAGELGLPAGIRAGRAVVAVGAEEGPDEVTLTTDLSGMARILPLALMTVKEEGMQEMKPEQPEN